MTRHRSKAWLGNWPWRKVVIDLVKSLIDLVVNDVGQFIVVVVNDDDGHG